MSIKHRTYQITAITSLLSLTVLLVLIFNSNPENDQTILYMSLFLFFCIVFYYSSRKYIAYEVRKRKSRRSGRRVRGVQEMI